MYVRERGLNHACTGGRRRGRIAFQPAPLVKRMQIFWPIAETGNEIRAEKGPEKRSKV